MSEDRQYLTFESFALTKVQQKYASAAMTKLLQAHTGLAGPDAGMGLIFSMTECLCVALETGCVGGYISPVQAALIQNAIQRAVDQRIQ